MTKFNLGDELSKEEETLTMSVSMEHVTDLFPPVVGGGILPKGSHMVVAGGSGIGKSLFRTQLALHLAFGIDFLDFSIPERHKVAVIQFENTDEMEADRIRMMCKGLGISEIGGRIFHRKRPFDVDLFYRWKPSMESIKAWVRSVDADVILYDPLSSLNRKGIVRNVRA
jgi:predicted ATP-dependent serine protease